MRCFKRTFLAISLVILVAATIPAVRAGDSADANWPKYITINESFQIGDLNFSPGTYYFRLTSNTVSRNVMMVYSLDRERWEGIIMGINAYRQDSSDKMSGFTFARQGNSKPIVLEYWFYPGWNRGIKFTRHDLESTSHVAQTKTEEPVVFAYSSR